MGITIPIQDSLDHAVNALANAGFVNMYNIIDSMEGDKVDDPGSVYHGKWMRNDWKNCGASWTFAVNPDSTCLPCVEK